jgi:hypothetical protein
MGKFGQLRPYALMPESSRSVAVSTTLSRTPYLRKLSFQSIA